MTIIQIGKKLIRSYREVGIKKSIKRCYDRFFRTDEKEWKIPKTEYTGKGDVLFINGCELEHPMRYRVLHQMEQFEQYGMICHEIYIKQISKRNVKRLVADNKCFVIFRCPFQKSVDILIKQIRMEKKKIFFDIDDLVIDTKYTDTIPYVQSLSDKERQLYNNNVNNMKKTLFLTDGCITTTERLCLELHGYVRNVLINRNTASKEMIQLSERVLTKKRKTEKVKIGYFSGSLTHNADIQLILPVLKNVLKRHTEVELHFVGELSIPSELNEWSSQIVVHSFVKWRQLPELISQVDINLCPLQNSIFNEAKSENKWIEAALVKVPTIASKIGAFDCMIQDGKTGILCENLQEWNEKLEILIQNSDLRETIANEAYEKVHNECTTINTGRTVLGYLGLISKY